MLGLTPSPPRPVVSALVGILALPAAAVATAVALSTPESVGPRDAGDRPVVLGMQVVAAEAPAVAARHGPGCAYQATLCAHWPQVMEELPFCAQPSAVAAGAE